MTEMNESNKASVVVRTEKTFWKAYHIVFDCFTYDSKWRRCRQGSPYKGSRCFDCAKEFEEGDSMSLIQVLNKPNRMVCRGCAESIKEALDAIK